MKYKVVVNQTTMIQNCSALKAMNVVMNILKANQDRLDIKVYYLSGSTWKLENSVVVNPPSLVSA